MDMDQLWLRAPGLALRLGPEDAPSPAWQLNPAAQAWSSGRRMEEEHWQALARTLRQALAEGRTQGVASAGQPPSVE